MLETVSLVFNATGVTIDNAYTRCNMNDSLERLKTVQHRIQTACLAVGRQAQEISLLAVSKRQPSEKISVFNSLGLFAFGENQLQEALEKQGELSGLDLQWHFIGTVQSTNKRVKENVLVGVKRNDLP